jgi:hypothetical protein
MNDSGEVHTLAIGDPSKLEADKWYVATFCYKKHNEVAQARFEVQVQLVGNLFALKNDFSEKYGEYSTYTKSKLEAWFAANFGNPTTGNSFFNIRVSESSIFNEDDFFGWPEGKNSGYDRVIWDFGASDHTYDYQPYYCGFGDYPVEVTDPNPPDPEDTQSGDDYNNLTSSVSGSGSSSSSKPDLYPKKLKFKNDKTKYYDDEKIKIDSYVGNVGKSVSSSIKKIALKLYRFKGEKENGDTKEVGSENMKGENLKSGCNKHEEFSFGAPDDENKYQFYVVADAKNAVSESNESNNKSKAIVCRVHKRPNIYVSDLTLNGSEARATFKNSGGESFWDVPVKWYLDGVHFADDNMRHWNIEHGDEKHESVNLINLSFGSHTLKVCADNFDDKDKSNNCKELTFTISAPVIIPEPIIIPDPIFNSSCEYFDVKKVFHAGLVDIWVIFKPELQSKIHVVGQTNPNDYWDNLPIYSGELCFQNWPMDASPEFAAYYKDNLGNKQWLVAKKCSQFFNGSSDPNAQHFIIYSNTTNAPAETPPEIDTQEYDAVENCQFFKLQKTSDIGEKVNYQIIFSPTIPSNLGFVGQKAPDDAWVNYPVSSRTIFINDWPKGQPIEFAVYYFNTSGNKLWLVAKDCPVYFNNNPDPNNQHFVVYLE